MPNITDSVGEGGANKRHDVAIVQLMLQLIKDASNNPYFAGEYNGAYGATTKTAIAAFQKGQKLLPASPGNPAKTGAMPAVAPAEKEGFIGVSSQTFAKI